MRALDNLLKQARLLRIARAVRVQDEIAHAEALAAAVAAEAERARLEDREPRRVTIEPIASVDGRDPDHRDPVHHWMDECAAAQLVLAALADPSLPEADSRRRRVIGVLDLSPAGPFVARAVEALDALIEEMRPQDAVFEAMWPRVCAHVAPLKVDPPESFDAGRARRSATRDVAQLAVESLLFEVVRGTIRAADARRQVAFRPDLPPVVLDDGRVRRAPAPRADAAVRAEAMRSTLAVPVADLAAVPQAMRGPGKAKSRTLLKAERRAARRREKEARERRIREGREAFAGDRAGDRTDGREDGPRDGPRVDPADDRAASSEAVTETVG